jgi:heat shock protein HtpX
MYLARVLGRAASSYLSGDDEDAQPSYRVYWIVVQLLEVIFGILASLLLYAFSRYREYHADAGGARFTTKHAMISALRTIHGLHQRPEYAAVSDEYATLKFE